MSASERQKSILDLIAKQGSVTVSELCARLQVSDMTVRRDLAALETASLLKRMHGGAVATHGRSYEPPLLVRSQECKEAKEAIARRAVGLIQEGDSVALDVGTTTMAMIPSLLEKQNITIMTASLPIATALADNTGIRVIVSGGILRPGEHSLVGDIAQDSFLRFHMDKVFIGIGGVDIEAGLTEYNLDDANTKRRIIQSGCQRILLADSSKYGRRVFASVASLAEFHLFVTDRGLAPDDQQAIEAIGVRVLIAD